MSTLVANNENRKENDRGRDKGKKREDKPQKKSRLKSRCKVGPAYCTTTVPSETTRNTDNDGESERVKNEKVREEQDDEDEESYGEEYEEESDGIMSMSSPESHKHDGGKRNDSMTSDRTKNRHPDVYKHDRRSRSDSSPEVTETFTGKLNTVTRKIDVRPARFTYGTAPRTDYYTNTPVPATPEGPRFIQDGTQLTFTHPGVQNDILKNLYSLQTRGDMCDVLIRVQGVDFKCHKIVLAAACPYFADLFRDIKSVRMDRLILEGLSAQSVAAMIGYFYMAKLIVDADDVEELLESAYYFKTNEVIQLCVDYLEINLAVHNCFNFYELATRHNIKDFRIKTFRYICWNFKSVVKEPRFLDLSEEVLHQIVASSQVKVKAEEEVYAAVWQWYVHQPIERKHSLAELCNDIHFQLIGLSFLEEKVKNEMYKVSETCRQKVDSAIKKHSTGAGDMKLENFRQVSDNVYIFVSSTNVCQMLDLFTCKTEQAPELHLPIGNLDPDYHVTVKAGKKLYTISKTKVLCFNAGSMSWEVFADGLPVADSGVCHTKTSIYVAGGKPNGKQLWELCLATKTWQQHPEMEVDRRSPAAACMGNTKPRLFVAGGFSLSQSCVLDTMECYNVTEKTWKTIKRTMNVPRLQPGIIVKGELVYVVGGRSMEETLNSVEIYDRSSQKWSIMDGPLIEGKLEPALILYEGKIYSIAGKGCVCIEVLEEAEKTRRWRMVGKLDKPYVGLQAVVYQPV